MSDLRKLIRQEIINRREFMVGTILDTPEVKAFDGSGGTGGPRWVAPVTIGSNRHLKNVPIKAVNGTRHYARRGSTVLLRRNVSSRFEVIGPGDRRAAVQIVKTYVPGNLTAQSTANIGFSFREETFEFYEGAGPPNSLWNDGSTPFPKVTIIDGDGNPV